VTFAALNNNTYAKVPLADVISCSWDGRTYVDVQWTPLGGELLDTPFDFIAVQP
jgi:hypothetical protein